MRKQWIGSLVLISLFGTLPAYAVFKSVTVCNEARLPNNAALDCAYIELKDAARISAQVNCHNNGTVALDVSTAFIAGSAASPAMMASPQTHINSSTGLALTKISLPALHSNSTLENAWTPVAGFDIPVSPVGTLRLTNHTNDTLSLVDCTAILNLGD
jgi:hypothetical protein